MISNETLLWAVFGIFVSSMLLLDLGVLNRKAHALSIKEATIWSVVWIVSALLFAGGIFLLETKARALEFLAGYLIEKSLSADNIFVFIMVFAYFDVSPMQQPRVLKWGILGAIVMRAVLIATGVTLINQFHWMTYVFGVLLLMTVIKMMLQGDEKFDPGKNWALQLLRRIIPVSKRYYDEHFFVRSDKGFFATPLLMVLVVIESSDLIFALDSIPAILAVTTDPFIVYTSNIFAILGLRALYFVLAGMVRVFEYLKPGIIIILTFVGVKMLIVDVYRIPIGISLAVIGVVLAISIIASWINLRRNGRRLREEIKATEAMVSIKATESHAPHFFVDASKR
ncbi:MAG: TerC family protein [candidate division KSB1 bacterium]|nr:TerC family protein [candidate division KSB1 bacterium]MDZ7302087.1 TerC family protein [candidate division KSB1 bacterium]MDZ7311128.1 TerC family protein [candidate division KSB1 bacterium]